MQDQISSRQDVQTVARDGATTLRATRINPPADFGRGVTTPPLSSVARPTPGRDIARDSTRDIGARILSRVSGAVGSGRSARNLERDAIVTVDKGRVRVAVPSEFIAEYVGRNFVPALRLAASAELTADGQQTLDKDVSVEIVVEAGAFARDRGGATTAPEPAPASGRGGRGDSGRDIGGGLGDRRGGSGGPRRPDPNRELRHRLSDFVVGECNRLAFTAASTIAAGTAPARFSPLFLHGPCGVGKTHLLQGLAAKAAERLGSNAGKGVKYTTAETFTNDFVQAVKSGSTEGFRRAFRDVEILCIDDIHFLASKTATQSEFLHTFDALGLSGRMVVLASDEAPRDIRSLGEALVSRFLSGAVIKVDPPDDATRIALVRQLSTSRGLALDDEAISLLAERGGRPLPNGSMPSVREIAGLLTRVEAMRNFMGDADHAMVLGRSMVAKALGLTSEAGRGPRRPVPASLIIDRVCRSLRVDQSDLMSKGRHTRVVLARALVTYLSRRLTTMSYPEIARSINRPNHSTVITAFNRITAQMAASQMVEGGPDLAEVSIQSLAERLEREIIAAAG